MACADVEARTEGVASCNVLSFDGKPLRRNDAAMQTYFEKRAQAAQILTVQLHEQKMLEKLFQGGKDKKAAHDDAYRYFQSNYIDKINHFDQRRDTRQACQQAYVSNAHITQGCKVTENRLMGFVCEPDSKVLCQNKLVRQGKWVEWNDIIAVVVSAPLPEDVIYVAIEDAETIRVVPAPMSSLKKTSAPKPAPEVLLAVKATMEELVGDKGAARGYAMLRFWTVFERKRAAPPDESAADVSHVSPLTAADVDDGVGVGEDTTPLEAVPRAVIERLPSMISETLVSITPRGDGLSLVRVERPRLPNSPASVSLARSGHQGEYMCAMRTNRDYKCWQRMHRYTSVTLSVYDWIGAVVAQHYELNPRRDAEGLELHMEGGAVPLSLSARVQHIVVTSREAASAPAPGVKTVRVKTRCTADDAFPCVMDATCRLANADSAVSQHSHLCRADHTVAIAVIVWAHKNGVSLTAPGLPPRLADMGRWLCESRMGEGSLMNFYMATKAQMYIQQFREDVPLCLSVTREEAGVCYWYDGGEVPPPASPASTTVTGRRPLTPRGTSSAVVAEMIVEKARNASSLNVIAWIEEVNGILEREETDVNVLSKKVYDVAVQQIWAKRSVLDVVRRFDAQHEEWKLMKNVESWSNPVMTEEASEPTLPPPAFSEEEEEEALSIVDTIASDIAETTQRLQTACSANPLRSQEKLQCIVQKLYDASITRQIAKRQTIMLHKTTDKELAEIDTTPLDLMALVPSAERDMLKTTLEDKKKVAQLSKTLPQNLYSILVGLRALGVGRL